MNARFLAVFVMSSLAFAITATTAEQFTLKNNETLTANTSPFTEGRLICRELGVASISIQGNVYLNMPHAYIHCGVIEFIGNSMLSANGNIEIIAERLTHISSAPADRAVIQSVKGPVGAGMSGVPQNDVPPTASTGKNGSNGHNGRDARSRIEWDPLPEVINRGAHHGGAGGSGGVGATGREGIEGHGGGHGAAGGKVDVTVDEVYGNFSVITKGGDGGDGGIGGIGGKGGRGGTGGRGGKGGNASTFRSAKNGGRGGSGGPGGNGGRGGTGGNGGNGGNGGDVTILLVEGSIDDTFSVENSGGDGGAGGAGGPQGVGGDGGRGGPGGGGGDDSIFRGKGARAPSGGVGPPGSPGSPGEAGRPGVPGKLGQRGLYDGRIAPLETFREVFDGA